MSDFNNGLGAIKPADCNVELRVKIEHVMREKKCSWRDAIFFLAKKVSAPEFKLQSY